jgi:serine/threonine-protein kinase
VLQDIGYALAYAHGRGVVHRDIKPDNIMIERATGRALLMDFGISRPITADVAMPGLTRIGEVVGTPEFMSPEQATGDTIDGRTDIYSLGLVALFALTGTKPVSGTSIQQIIAKQITGVLPPAQTLRSDVPAALCTAIDRCVAKSPADRFATAGALVDALDAAQLAVPDVPLAVRLFAQDLTTLSLMVIFFVAMFPLIARATSAGGPADMLIPLLVLVSVAVARVALSFGGARRLAADGFTPNDILKGMRTVADERAAVRDAYRANVAMRARRRRTVRVTAVIGLAAIAAIVLVLRGATKSAKTPAGNLHFIVGPFGFATILAATMAFAAAFLIVIRSPFRAPPGDRIFELVWLGPLGRAFVRLAARNVMRAEEVTAPSLVSRAIPTSPLPVPTPPAADLSAAQRLAELEARLAALERGPPGKD